MVNPISFALGAVSAVAVFEQRTVVEAAPDLWASMQVMGSQATGIAVAVILSIGAVLSLRLQTNRGNRITGSQSLGETFRAAHPHLVTLEEAPVLSLVEWSHAKIGSVHREFLQQEVRRALSEQVTVPWAQVESVILDYRHALIMLFALHGTDRYVAFRDGLAEMVTEAGCKAAAGMELNARARVRTAEMMRLAARDFLSPHRLEFGIGAPVRLWIDEVASQHFWSESVLMGGLAKAREHGPLPETDFAWLIDADRPLAMALNAVGRPSFHPESLGAACHFNEELRARCPLSVRMVDAGVRSICAVVSLENAVCSLETYDRAEFNGPSDALTVERK